MNPLYEPAVYKMKGKNMDIDALHKRVQKGDRKAFKKIVIYYQAKLMSFVLSMVNDIHTARDICQETFIKAYYGIKQFDERRGSFTTWLYTIAKNRSIDHLRKDRQRETVEIKDEHAVIQPEGDKEGMYENLNGILQSQPEGHRLSFELVLVHGLSCEEAGELLGVPAGTVKSRIHKTKQNLITSLKGME